MKILQVIPYFAPAWHYGGPVRVCYDLSKELVKRGHEVTVYTTDTLDAGNRIRQVEEVTDGIRIRRFRNMSRYLAHKHNIFFSPEMRRSMKELKSFDVIHMHEYRTLQNVIVHHYAKKRGIPYVLQVHGDLPRVAAKQRLKKLYDNLWGYELLRDASRVIALNHTEAEQYQAMGLRADRIEIVPNGVDLSEFETLPPRGAFRKKCDLDSGCKIVLYLGRIHQTKSIDLLVKAFAGVSESLVNAKLAIVGPDDGYLPTLKELVRKLNIQDKVLFPGPLYGRDKLAAYVDADVFATPSFLGFPVTFLESCACGTPIVTTTNGDSLDWIHDQVGYVTEFDEECIKDSLAVILNDSKIAERFGERGRKLARERFNWSKVAAQVEDMYSRAASCTA